MGHRHTKWDGCLNARDLGGLPTRDGGSTRLGVLIRGDTVCNLSEDGRRQLVADGVRTVVDLRGSKELEREPNPFADVGGVAYLHRPLNDPAVDERMAGLSSPPERYEVMIDANGERLVAIVDALATAPRAVLFHCHAGRDRTGLVAALALRLVGVPDDVVERDFTLSDERLNSRYERWRLNFNAEQRERFDRSIAEGAASIRAALRRVDERWGGADAYLVAHGLAEERIELLRAELVEAQYTSETG